MGLAHLPGSHALSSSFGIQAAVMLHLVNSVQQDTQVILTDTGYLFPETYRFIDQLTERLGLNLKVYRAETSAAWQEARFGKLWQQGLEGLEQYNRINKVEPMQRALAELEVGTWFAGLRRSQASTGKGCRFWPSTASATRCCRLSSGATNRCMSISRAMTYPIIPLGTGLCLCG